MIYKKRGDRYSDGVEISPPRHIVHPAAFSEKNQRIEILEKRLMGIISGQAGLGFYLKTLTKSLLQPILKSRRK